MKCEVIYSRVLRRGVCHAPHVGGGGHYVRLPVWEMMWVAAAAAALALPFAFFVAGCWLLGKE